MSATVRLSAGLTALALATASPAADAPTVPRYRFAPGQELTFRSASEFKFGEGDNAGAHGSKADWTAWVVRANPDGSFSTDFLKPHEKKPFSTNAVELNKSNWWITGFILPAQSQMHRIHSLVWRCGFIKAASSSQSSPILRLC